MALILCIETATTNCSVALSENGSAIALMEDDTPGYSHAEKLHVFIEKVMEGTPYNLSDLDAIAISKGPGSYTGLRIGVSAAKGLCYALDIPLISVPTLAILANSANPSTFIIPMLDARRMEVYSAIYNAVFDEVRETKAEVLTQDSFEDYLEQATVTFIGSGVEKFQRMKNHPNALFISNIQPTASKMVGLADSKYKKNDIEDVAYFEPYYLKDFKVNR